MAASHTTDTVRREQTWILRRQTLSLHGQVQPDMHMQCPGCSLAGHMLAIPQKPCGCTSTEPPERWGSVTGTNYKLHCEFSELVLASIQPLHMASKRDVVCLHCLTLSSLLLCGDILHLFIFVHWLTFCLLWLSGLFLPKWGYILIKHMENPDQRCWWWLPVSWRGHHTVYFGTNFCSISLYTLHQPTDDMWFKSFKVFPVKEKKTKEPTKLANSQMSFIHISWFCCCMYKQLNIVNATYKSLCFNCM